MYNQELYNTVLERTHHKYRRVFDKNAASDFTNRDIHPSTRMAMRLHDVFLQETPVILEKQNIVFIRTVTDVPDIFTQSEWQEVKQAHYIHELGYVSNICADYGRVLSLGLDKIKEDILARLEKAKKENDIEGITFLESANAQIESVYMLVDKYKAEAQKQGREDIAAVLDRVPKMPAQTFREALQFFRILHYTLWAEGEYHNTVGRFDLYAYPYLKNDLDSGNLTQEQAEALLEEFFLTFNFDNDKYTGVQLGDNGQSMMLGGVDENGKDSFNLLSSLCLKTSCRLKLIDPKINLRVDKNTPRERFIEATELTKAGLGFPQYSNDDVMIPALTAHGYDLRDARNYSVAACWEFIIAGVGMDVNNIGALSFPKAVQEAMYDCLESAETFEDFLECTERKVKEQAEKIADGIHNLYFIPAPFYSVLMDGCVEKARDISTGGKYNNFGIHGTGIATASDSLQAIKDKVFINKDTSKQQMIDAVKNDFANQPELLHACRFEEPKMGDNNESVDEISCRLLNAFADALAGKKNERGGIFRPGTGSAMFYLWHAREVDASADGRHRGEAFGTNFSPSLFVRSKGPFSVIQSFTKQPFNRVMNGGPLTMEFHSSVFDSREGIETVADLVREFVLFGGHQLQLNSINRDRLIDAQKHPENYRNLIVRIWGWSAYFVELDKEYQDHLIARQEFDE